MPGGTNKSNGYTMVETLIFLAVSSLIAISSLMLVSGRQRKAEFSDAVRNLESKIQDVMNDVATGFYTNDGNIKCEVNGAGDIVINPVTGPDPVEQGTNQDCIFVGKVIQFAPAGSESRGLKVYTVVGRRLNAGNITTSITEAAPKIIYDAGGAFNNLIENYQVGPVKIAKLGLSETPTDTFGGVAILTNFKIYNGLGSLESGSITSDTYLISGSTHLGQDETSFVGDPAVDGANFELSSLTSTNANPSNGIGICVESQGTDQHAVILIGGSGAAPTATRTIYGNGSTC